MKKYLMTFAVLAVVVLAVVASGCLDSEDKTNNDTVTNATSAPIQSLIFYTNGNDVIASATVMIMGTHSQSIDKDNITVKINGSYVDVVIPAVNSGSMNTKDIGYEDVEFVVGKVSDLKDGKTYTLTNNGKIDEMKQYKFEIVNGQLYTFIPAGVEKIEFLQDGKDIVASVIIPVGGGAYSIDSENITVSKGFDDKNEFGVYIPLKIKDGPSTLEMKWGEEKFTLGQTDKLENGTYTFNVNGHTASFTMEDGKMTVNN
ncbi:MAG: hypothetical protein RBQ94_02495 [Methanimicrococcus sp.]|nr:hypothetical protein [Methanimicrococcus sp.]